MATRRPAPPAGLTSITVDDVRRFYADHFSRDRLIVGVGGGYPDGFAEAFAAPVPGPSRQGRRCCRSCPSCRPARRNGAPGRGGVDRGEGCARRRHLDRLSHRHHQRPTPTSIRLTVARSYLGEHRTFNGVLMNRLRADRGLNYGDYAYIENFIQDGWSTFPHPNMLRRQQHFEIWLRPVPPQNALFALRGAVYFTRQLIAKGIPARGIRVDPALPAELRRPVDPGRFAAARLRHRRRAWRARIWSKS